MERENHRLSPNTFCTAPLEIWAATIQRSQSTARQCFLEQVVHYKALSGKEHEFLVVYVNKPSGSKIVLGIDRNAPIAPSQQTSGSASQDMDTAWPPTVPSSSARYLNIFVEESSHLAYDSVQVSHDGPAPILDQHGPCVPLYKITFPSTYPPLTASTSTSSPNSDTTRSLSLLGFSKLLLLIHTHFPSYTLLQYQCYFFARMTCLVLMDIFDGAETELEGGKRAATWCGVHVSQYSAGSTALQNLLVIPLPLVAFPALIVPAGLFAVYSTVMLYDGRVVRSELDRRRIR